MKKLFIALISALMFMTSCNAQTENDGDVSVKEAREMIQNEDVVVIDVRTPNEYQNGHIEGAKLINFMGDDFDQQIEDLPKNQEYIVYCQSGNRSSKAVKKMEAAGFTNVHNMTGGWGSWSTTPQN